MDEGVEMEGLNVGSVRKHHVHLEVSTCASSELHTARRASRRAVRCAPTFYRTTCLSCYYFEYN